MPSHLNSASKSSLLETHLWTIPRRNPAARHLRADRRGRPLPRAKHLQARESLRLRYCIPVPHGEVCIRFSLSLSLFLISNFTPSLLYLSLVQRPDRRATHDHRDILPLFRGGDDPRGAPILPRTRKVDRKTSCTSECLWYCSYCEQDGVSG